MDVQRGGDDDLRIRLKDVTIGESVIAFPDSGVTAIVGPNNVGKSTFLRELLNSQTNPAAPRLIVGAVSLDVKGDWTAALRWLESQTTTNHAPGGVRSFQRMGAVLDDYSAQNAWEGLLSGDGMRAWSGMLVHYADTTSKDQVLAPAPRLPAGEAPSMPMQKLFVSGDALSKVRALARESFGISLEMDEMGSDLFLRVGEVTSRRPALGEPKEEYHAELASLPLLARQGDGLKSYLANLMPLVTATYSIVLIDEPEAYLHPPQALRLGRELAQISQELGIQVVLATHDRSLLAGLLDSEAEISIVRLIRRGNSTEAAQLSAETLKGMRSDPILRYSNVLDGIFHQLVVAVEGWDDCTFYRAALDHLVKKGRVPSTVDVLFVPTNGKQALHKFVTAVRQASVPAVASPDLDILRNKKDLETLVVASGGDWEAIKPLLNDFYQAANIGARTRSRGDVLKEVTSALQPSEGDYDRTTRAAAKMIVERDTVWPDARRIGVIFFEGDARVKLTTLLDALDQCGVILVRDGQLESFYGEMKKGSAWINEAMAHAAFQRDPVLGHVYRLIEVGIPGIASASEDSDRCAD